MNILNVQSLTTTDEDGREPIAIGHPSHSCERKSITMLKTITMFSGEKFKDLNIMKIFVVFMTCIFFEMFLIDPLIENKIRIRA